MLYLGYTLTDNDLVASFLDDINNYIDSGTLNQPTDIDTPSGSQSPVTEIAAVQANSSSVF